MRPSVKRGFSPTHPHTNYTQEGRAVTVRRDIEKKDLFPLFTPQRFFLHTAVKAKGGKIDESGAGANKCIAISRSLLSLSSGARRGRRTGHKRDLPPPPSFHCIREAEALPSNTVPSPTRLYELPNHYYVLPLPQ